MTSSTSRGSDATATVDVPSPSNTVDVPSPSKLSIPIALAAGVTAIPIHWVIVACDLGLPSFFELFYRQISGVNVGTLVYWFLVVHVIRVNLGVIFAEYDRSFDAALAKKYTCKASSHRKTTTKFVTLPLLVSNPSLLLASQVGWFFVLFLLLHVACFVTFHWHNWKILYCVDEQKKANHFIGFGDLIYTVFALMMGFVYLFQVAWDLSLWLSMLLGGYVLIFSGEITSQYLPVTLSMWKKFVQAKY